MTLTNHEFSSNKNMSEKEELPFLGIPVIRSLPISWFLMYPERILTDIFPTTHILIKNKRLAN